MKEVLLTLFHIFIIGAVYLLLIGGVLILSGRFDSWTRRLYFWRRKKRPDTGRDFS